MSQMTDLQVMPSPALTGVGALARKGLLDTTATPAEGNFVSLGAAR